MNDLIQQMLMGGRNAIQQGNQGALQSVLQMQPQAGAEEVDLEAALENPAIQQSVMKQADIARRERYEKLIDSDPAEYINAAKEKAKPKGKLGKIGGVLGEILAGLAHASESPGMARDRRVEKEARANYDNLQQNARQQLDYLRLNQKSMTDAEKLDLQKNRMKIEQLAREKGIKLKESELEFRDRWEKSRNELNKSKLTEVERHNKQEEILKGRYLAEKANGTGRFKNYEEFLVNQHEKGLITKKEFDKSLEGYYKAKRPVKGVLPKPSETSYDLGNGVKYKEFGAPKPQKKTNIGDFGNTAKE